MTDNAILTRTIGKSGINASAVGLGTWAIGGWMWGGTDERVVRGVARVQGILGHDAVVTLRGLGYRMGQG